MGGTLEHRVRNRIEVLELAIRDAKAELRSLRALLNVDEKPQENSGKTKRKVGATEAVLALVREHPGIARKSLIERLVDKIETKSPNKRHLIYMTIANLRNSKRLREENGGLYLHGGRE